MNERLKKLRRTLGLTQQEFADRISIKRNTLANYEVGRNEPLDAVISLICREFNVNENWLRTGEGDMYMPLTRSQEITAFVGKFLKGDDDNFKRRFIAILAELDEAEWELIEKMSVKLATEIKKD